ncbi:MAG: helix-turn-helix transcriptional regulator [Thomasclavelia sp.]|jgi:transcriptional regulator with XRE-family HTH domain|nr:helix-turn-helix transcriptional regulator [Thomasclavelia sp.]
MNDQTIKLNTMIKKYMKINNLTMKELGALLGKSESAVSYWIKGTSTPKIGEIQKMADMFNLTTDQMIYGDTSDYENLSYSVEAYVENSNDFENALKKIMSGSKELRDLVFLISELNEKEVAQVVNYINFVLSQRDKQ